MTKIAVIVGNPRKKCFSQFIAQKCKEGADSVGNEVKIIDLSKLNFYPVRLGGYGEEAPLEKDLVEAQESIKWADKLVIIYPLWGGSMPAILKGFFERVFTGNLRRYLKGKSAHVIVTMGMPSFFYWLWYGGYDYRALKIGILKFLGMKSVRITTFGMVDKASDNRKNKFLDKVKKIGAAK